MKKILAGLLSLALLLGSVPVYGAEDAILSQPNTENITEQSELSETAENSGETEQEPETPGGESEIPGEEPESAEIQRKSRMKIRMGTTVRTKSRKLRKIRMAKKYLQTKTKKIRLRKRQRISKQQKQNLKVQTK